MGGMAGLAEAARGVALRFEGYTPPVYKEHWQLPVGTCAAYLAGVWATKRWAAARAARGEKPLSLKWMLVAHNFMLSAGSLALWSMMVASLATRWARVENLHGAWRATAPRGGADRRASGVRPPPRPCGVLRGLFGRFRSAHQTSTSTAFARM